MAIFEAIFAALDACGGRYVVVGGVATVLHGHARLTADVDIVVDLDPTSPLRHSSDIQACLALLVQGIDVVITAYESDKNPYFNMVEQRSDGVVSLVKRPEKEIAGRQMAPKVYAMNASIYVWRRRSLSKGLWGGRAALHVMPRERSIDIDSELDFKFVELLMREKQEGQ